MGKTAAGAALLAALWAGAATAQSSAQLSISDVRYALVDLDPNDGVKPSLTFLAPQASQFSSALVTLSSGGDTLTDFSDGAYAFAPLSLAASTAAGSASAAISGGVESGFSLQATGMLGSGAGSAELFNQVTTGTLGFVLSPMTAVTFSSRVMLSLGLQLPPALASGAVSATARIDLTSDVLGANAPVSEWANLNTAVAGTQSYDQPLVLSMSNALGTATTNDLQLRSSISARVVAAPVPEPATWAMLAGGLALLAHACRRRRQ